MYKTYYYCGKFNTMNIITIENNAYLHKQMHMRPMYFLYCKYKYRIYYLRIFTHLFSNRDMRKVLISCINNYNKKEIAQSRHV